MGRPPLAFIDGLIQAVQAPKEGLAVPLFAGAVIFMVLAVMIESVGLVG